jgi:hypothetical protein
LSHLIFKNKTDVLAANNDYAGQQSSVS